MCAAAAALVVGAMGLPARAQSASPTESMASPAPLLEQMSREMEALHRHIEASLVRVHTPDRLAIDNGPAEELLRKWEQRLEPAVRQTLQQQAAAMRAMQQAMASDDPFAIARANAEHFSSAVLIIRPFDPADLVDRTPLGILNAPHPHVPAPATIGVVIDGRGLVLVPAHFDHDVVAQRVLRVTLPEGGQGEATFVGSDRQTGLTLLRLATPVGKPCAMAEVRPADGSLVMVISTHDDGAHLTIWSSGGHESGLIITPDGRVAGFANAGQFLSASAAQPVVQQLTDHGSVRRAVLGVRVNTILQSDPSRPLTAGLAKQPGMRVEKILAGSPADRAGLRAGDVILAIAGEPVGDVPSFAAAVAARSGETDLRVLRDGQQVPLTVDLTRE